MRYTVDEALCAGHGQCFVMAPDVMVPDDEGFNNASGIIVEAGDEHLDSVVAASRACPEQAIRVLSDVRA